MNCNNIQTETVDLFWRASLDLLGTPPEFRQENKPGESIDLDGRLLDPADGPAAVARREIAGLMERRESVADLDEVNKALAISDLDEEDDDELKRLRRYEATLYRRLRWCLDRVHFKSPDHRRTCLHLQPEWCLTPPTQARSRPSRSSRPSRFPSPSARARAPRVPRARLGRRPLGDHRRPPGEGAEEGRRSPGGEAPEARTPPGLTARAGFIDYFAYFGPNRAGRRPLLRGRQAEGGKLGDLREIYGEWVEPRASPTNLFEWWGSPEARPALRRSARITSIRDDICIYWE